MKIVCKNVACNFKADVQDGQMVADRCPKCKLHENGRVWFNTLPDVLPGPQTAADFCEAARKAVGGDRARTHGAKGLNFTTSDILHEALDRAEAEAVAAGRSHLYGPLKFALRMILAKLSRIISGEHNDDDYIDIAGYAGCAGEVAKTWQLQVQREG